MKVPICSLVADGDYITPSKSSLAIETAAPKAAHKLIRMAGGHIGLATGSAAQKRAWPEIAAWLTSVEQPAPVVKTGSKSKSNGRARA